MTVLIYIYGGTYIKAFRITQHPYKHQSMAQTKINAPNEMTEEKKG